VHFTVGNEIKLKDQIELHYQIEDIKLAPLNFFNLGIVWRTKEEETITMNFNILNFCLYGWGFCDILY
jgi:hypothetical protein